MLRFKPLKYSKSSSTTFRTPNMDKTIDITYSIRKAKSSLIWGLVNVILLALVVYDLAYKCPLFTTTFNYLEYGLTIVFSLNVIYHLVRYFFLMISLEPNTASASESKVSVGVDVPEGQFCQLSSSKTTSTTSVVKRMRLSTPDTSIQNSTFSERPLGWKTESPNETNYTTWTNQSPNTTMNTSVLNSSALNAQLLNNSTLNTSMLNTSNLNESQNYSLSSPSWIYYRGSPNQQMITLTPPTRFLYRGDESLPEDSIEDEKMLKQYLYDYDTYEKVQNTNNSGEPPTNLLSTFWAHPVTQSQHEVSMYLRKAQYQLSQANLLTDVNNTTGNKDEGSPLNVVQRGNEVWKKLQVEPQTLTQWNANLRMWISQTILERIINEIYNINIGFQNHNFQDVQIGSVGLERLRKTAQTIQAQQYVSTLPALLPFLEVTPNQEYLVKRLKELVKGGCMSEFKWNGGSSFNGKDWDDSLPTDSAIIMHSLSTYLDSQLLPLPSQPDAKPFSKEHYIKMNEKIPVNPSTLAINQITEKPPHFRLIVGEDVYEVLKGHNNLFHTILLFLYYVNQKEHGMLGKVNMGKSGVNMLWIIDH